MSIILVVFPGAPKPCPDAIAADKELDRTLEKRVKGIFASPCNSYIHIFELRSIMHVTLLRMIKIY